VHGVKKVLFFFKLFRICPNARLFLSIYVNGTSSLLIFYYLIHLFVDLSIYGHHRTNEINHQPDATVFQFIILTFVYSSTCFGRFMVPMPGFF
jgi:hypothetical protein